MKLTTMLLSSLLFFFSSLGFAASDYQTSANDDRAQVTTCAPTQGAATTVNDFIGNDGEANHSCSCAGTQACTVSCAYDKSAKCGKDTAGYCSCSCS